MVRSSRPVAIIVRAHSADEKTLGLIADLDGLAEADVYVCANETVAPIIFDAKVKKLIISISNFNDIGVSSKEQYSMRHMSDIIFYLIRDALPEYNHYALIEYDVQLQTKNFIPDLCRLLRSDFSGADLVSTYVHPQGPTWHWYGSASRHFPAVLSAFFPFVILSAAAIDFLRILRSSELCERTAKGLGHDPNGSNDPEEPMFCEAFVPSALAVDGQWKMLDFNEILPNSYHPATFNIGPPVLFEVGAVYDPAVAMVHPVCPAGDTLRKHLYFARIGGTIDQFTADLRSRRWNVSHELIETVLAEAMA